MDRKFLLTSELRRKASRSEVEDLALHYHRILANISTVLVEESKCHYTQEQAIDRIRTFMREVYK